MHTLTVTFIQGATNCILGFATADKAAAAAKRLLDAVKDYEPGRVDLHDDYGRAASIPVPLVLVVLQGDSSKEHAANADLSLEQAHAQLKLNQRVAEDPVLKLMAGVMQARSATAPGNGMIGGSQ